MVEIFSISMQNTNLNFVLPPNGNDLVSNALLTLKEKVKMYSLTKNDINQITGNIYPIFNK